MGPRARNPYNAALYGPQVATTMAGMLTMGYLINQIQDYGRWGGDKAPYEKTVVTESVRAFERVGFLGPLSKFTDSMLYAKFGFFSTFLGPSAALMGEGSIYAGDLLIKGKPNNMANFIAKNASIFGRIKGSREPLNELLEDNLKEIAKFAPRYKPRKSFKRLGE